VQRDCLCAAGLHLGQQVTTRLDIIRRIAIGDSKKGNADCPATFLREIEKALPGIAFKTGEFGCFPGCLSIFQREDETAPCTLWNDKADNVGIGGTFGGKTYLHLKTAFQRSMSDLRETLSAPVLEPL
jgi:hypothetical protein